MKSSDESGNKAKWTTKKGNKLSEAQALVMSVEVEKSDSLFENGAVLHLRPVGRPPLGNDGTSPQITFRVPRETREKAELLARSEGVSVSALARQALEEFIARTG